MKLNKYLCAFFCLILFVGCEKTSSSKEETKEYTYTCDASNKCSSQFLGPFDTQFQVIAYAEDQAAFVENLALIETRFTYYNALFDKYSDYEGVNNVKTINDNAGIAPVKVEKPLLDLIKMGIEDAKNYSDKVNIALGPVLEVWHSYREKNDGSVPTLEELQAKTAHIDLDQIVIDEEASTVFLKEKGMSLDVGATAKGYACELVKQELIEKGMDNFLISAGGNIVSHGKRLTRAASTALSEVLPDCRNYYTVDIMSPQDGAYENVRSIAALILKEQSAVTSGDYQRYFIGDDGVYYHHLVDPDTLYPAHYFRSVTIITEDSGLADFLSSATFLLPLEEGKALIESIDGVEAVWLLNDGTITHTDGLVEGENCHFYVEVDQ